MVNNSSQYAPTGIMYIYKPSFLPYVKNEIINLLQYWLTATKVTKIVSLFADPRQSNLIKLSVIQEVKREMQ